MMHTGHRGLLIRKRRVPHQHQPPPPPFCPNRSLRLSPATPRRAPAAAPAAPAEPPDAPPAPPWLLRGPTRSTICTPLLLVLSPVPSFPSRLGRRPAAPLPPPCEPSPSSLPRLLLVPVRPRDCDCDMPYATASFKYCLCLASRALSAGLRSHSGSPVMAFLSLGTSSNPLAYGSASVTVSMASRSASVARDGLPGSWSSAHISRNLSSTASK